MTHPIKTLLVLILALSLVAIARSAVADQASFISQRDGLAVESERDAVPGLAESRTGPATSCATPSDPEAAAEGGETPKLTQDSDCGKLPVRITKVEFKGRRNATDQVEVTWEADAPPCLRITEFKVTVEVGRDGGVTRSGSAKVDGQKRATVVYVTAPSGDGPIKSYKSFVTATASRTVTGGASKVGGF